MLLVAILVLGTAWLVEQGVDAPERTAAEEHSRFQAKLLDTIAEAVIALIAGAAALLLVSSGIGVLLFIVTVYAAMAGVLELYAGLRARGAAQARDWVTVGGFTALAAIIFVLIPPDPILATGLIGAYAMVLGVFLVIAGLSLKWAAAKPGEAEPVEGKVSS